MNFPQIGKYKILLILRHLQQTQLNPRKKQPQKTNSICFRKDVGHLKNRNGWQLETEVHRSSS